MKSYRNATLKPDDAKTRTQIVAFRPALSGNLETPAILFDPADETYRD